MRFPWGVVPLLCFVGCKTSCGSEQISATDAEVSTTPRSGGDPSFPLPLAGEPGCRFDHLVLESLPSGTDCTDISGQGFEGAPVGRSPGLASFCRLSIPQSFLTKRAGAEAVLEQAASLMPKGAVASPDCIVVQGLGEGGEPDANPAEALALLGRLVGTEPLGRPDGLRVVVVDSAPTGQTPDWSVEAGTDDHGSQVGRLLSQLACPAPSVMALAAPAVPGPACAFEVTSVRALARLDPREASGRRARRGSLSELATAIETAALTAPRPDRTVINLSVGWDPAAHPEYTDPRRRRSAALKSVERALSVASCTGAMAVAATGPEFDWPLSSREETVFPAGWATISRPGRDRCQVLLGPSASELDESVPLVVGVGSATSFSREKRRLPSASATQRAGAAPALYAYGGYQGQGGGLRGSSAAAPVIAASFAWLRMLLPDTESQSDVLQSLFQAGIALQRAPSISLPLASLQSPPPLMLQLCRVVAGFGPSPPPLNCPFGLSGVGAPPPFPEAAHEVKLASVDVHFCPKVDTVRVYAEGASSKAAACAFGNGPDAFQRPFARPDGLAPSCRRCFGRLDRRNDQVEVVLDLNDAAYPPAYLVFSVGDGAAIHPLGDIDLGPGQVHLIKLDLPGPAPKQIDARVYFVSPGGIRSAEPLRLTDINDR